MQTANAHHGEPEASFASPQKVGEGQRPDKLQGHWILARAGKRVLRPGGLELTRRMLDALGQAEKSGLSDACASVVYGEAILSMQGQEQKNRIFAEARRLLAVGGRYGIHELCFLPDDISDAVRHEIQAAMSKEIHVGVQPLLRTEWVRLFERNGMKVAWTSNAPMHLLEPRRVLQDEGIGGAMRIAFNIATNAMLRHRILAMRRVFQKYGEHLGAISMVGKREPRDA